MKDDRGGEIARKRADRRIYGVVLEWKSESIYRSKWPLVFSNRIVIKRYSRRHSDYLVDVDNISIIFSFNY